MLSELADERLIGEFTIGEVRTVYAAIWANCSCVVSLEDETDVAVGLENDQGSSTFQLPEPEFVNWVAHFSNLSVSKVHEIVKLLTLNRDQFHCNLISQPIVASQLGTHFLAPRIFVGADPNKMISTALTSGPIRQWYDRHSSLLEQRNLDIVERTLRRLRWNLHREIVLTGSKGEIKPDLIMYDQSKDLLVVGDFKNTFLPAGPSAVFNRLREARKAVAQVQRYTDFVHSNPLIVRNLVPEFSSSSSVRGLVLFRFPMPLPFSYDRAIVVGDWWSAAEFIRRQQRISLPEMMSWLERRPDADFTPKQVQFDKDEIAVGDWTYIRHSLSHK